MAEQEWSEEWEVFETFPEYSLDGLLLWILPVVVPLLLHMLSVPSLIGLPPLTGLVGSGVGLVYGVVMTPRKISVEKRGVAIKLPLGRYVVPVERIAYVRTASWVDVALFAGIRVVTGTQDRSLLEICCRRGSNVLLSVRNPYRFRLAVADLIAYHQAHSATHPSTHPATHPAAPTAPTPSPLCA